jgi:hypothetical protein
MLSTDNISKVYANSVSDNALDVASNQYHGILQDAPNKDEAAKASHRMAADNSYDMIQKLRGKKSVDNKDSDGGGSNISTSNTRSYNSANANSILNDIKYDKESDDSDFFENSYDKDKILDKTDIKTYFNQDKTPGLSKAEAELYQSLDTTAERQSEYGSIVDSLADKGWTEEEVAYFNTDNNKLVTQKDIMTFFDKNGDKIISEKEAYLFDNMSTEAKRKNGYDILKSINDKKTGGTTKEEIAYFDTNKDKDVDMLDILSKFDTNKDGVISSKEATAFKAVDTVEKRKSTSNILDSIKNGGVSAEEMSYFDIDKDKDVDMLDINLMFDKNKDGVISSQEANAFKAVDTIEERKITSDILNSITNGGVSAEEIDYFDTDKDKDVDMLDIRSKFDINKDDIVSSKEASAFQLVDTIEERKITSDILNSITNSGVSAEEMAYFDTDKDKDVDMNDINLLFDTNKDGVISSQEASAFQLVDTVEKRSKDSKQAYDSGGIKNNANLSMMRNSLKKQGYDAADANNRGGITNRDVSLIFDNNVDGVISAEELKAFTRVKDWSKVDTDGDKKISKEEYQAAVNSKKSTKNNTKKTKN